MLNIQREKNSFTLYFSAYVKFQNGILKYIFLLLPNNIFAFLYFYNQQITLYKFIYLLFVAYFHMNS